MNDDWVLPHHVAPAKPARTPGERLWEVKRDGRTIACELRDESKSGAGFDVVIHQDGELSFSRRCPTEESAQYVAGALKQEHLKSGWVEKGGV